MFLSLALLAVRPAIRSVWGVGVLFVFLHSLVDFPMQIPALAAAVFIFLGALAGRESYNS